MLSYSLPVSTEKDGDGGNDDGDSGSDIEVITGAAISSTVPMILLIVVAALVI